MIELMNGYKVRVDDHAYTLIKEQSYIDKKTKKPVEKVCGYYSGLSGALNALGKELAREKHREGLQPLAKAVEAIRESNEAVRQLIESEVGKIDG